MPLPSAAFRSKVEALCASYRRFLEANQGDRKVGEMVFLYGFNFIEEYNLAHEVDEFLSDYVCIGNDSGDEEFLLKRDSSETVFGQDPGCFGSSEPRLIHPSFSQWVDMGCPLPKDPEQPIPLHGQIWLLYAPPDGMKGMLAVKKLLGADWSIPQMQRMLANLPALLIEKGAPFAVHRSFEQHLALRPLIGFTKLGVKTMHRFSDYSAT